MPKSKYIDIYKDLKDKIENGFYNFQQFLPPELNLIEIYGCSRNTLRRAISKLVHQGYVQTMQGKGVQNIYQPNIHTTFLLGSIESFSESASRNGFKSYTRVLEFREIIVDKGFSYISGFNQGDELYYILRLHYLDDEALIINHNYFLKSVVKDLNKDIAEKSIYKYLESDLKINIVTSKRIMTVEKMTSLDEKYLSLKDYNCLAVVTSNTYNDNGVMFEYTQSRHRPDFFGFHDIASRK